MCTYKTDPHNAKIIIDTDYQTVVIPFYIEYYTIVRQEACT